ncbi:DedA family protein [Paenibacillus marinisediminis]
MNEMMWAISHYGYFALFFLMALGLVGLPIPDETVMVVVGSMTVDGPLKYPHAFAVCALGSMIGMIISYFVGRKVGKPLIDRFGSKIMLTPARIQAAERWFQKYGPYSIIFGYFIPGFRHIIFYLAGMSRMKFSIYFSVAMIGNLLWVGTFLTVGHVVGIHWETTVHWLREQRAYALPAMAAIILVAVLYSVWVYRKRKNVV